MYYELFHAVEFDTCRKPLVLLGGMLTDTTDDLREIARALSVDRDVLIMDIRGTGRTGVGPTPGSYTLFQHNVDIQRLIEAIWNQDPSQRPVIIGFSDRGKIALAIGLSAHQRISGVIVCGTSGGGSLEVPGPRRALLESLYAQDHWSAPDMMTYAKAITGRRPFKTNQPAVEWFVSLRFKGDFAEGVQRNLAFANTTMGPVQFISDPTLVMHGSEDEIYKPETGLLLSNKIGPNSSFRLIEGAPHAFWLTDRDRLLEEITEFVRTEVDTCD